MGSVTSALTRTRNALVKVGSEPENHDPERSQSAPESDRVNKKSARFNVSSPTGRQSSRQSLSEVLSRQDSDGGKQSSRRKASEAPQGVANEDAESSARPQASFARSKSQSALWNAITAGMGIKGKEQKAPLNDPRSPEEILADDLPATDEPDATEKTAIRFAVVGLKIVTAHYLLTITNPVSGRNGTSTAVSSSLSYSGVFCILLISFSVTYNVETRRCE